MLEAEGQLYFTPKYRFLAEIATQEDQDTDQQAIRMYVRDVLILPVRGILIMQSMSTLTPSRVESFVFADLVIGAERSAKIVESVVDADALLDQRLTPPITSGTNFVNTLGQTSQNVRFDLWSRAQTPNTRLILGAVFT